MFNNRHLATVVLAIADDSVPTEFTTRQLAGFTRLPDSVIRPILLRLLGADLLIPTHSSGGTRGAKYYRAAVETPAWTSLEALCKALKGSIEAADPPGILRK
ncbi:hypothetical protein [Nocardia sp. NPDC050175]|uniref:hypothetical protein n=1 Tax=Nocardia sp. NPDC050175 TaxID=3364317 RepID=UPI00378A4822